jgi:hypothetical protein
VVSVHKTSGSRRPSHRAAPGSAPGKSATK